MVWVADSTPMFSATSADTWLSPASAHAALASPHTTTAQHAVIATDRVYAGATRADLRYRGKLRRPQRPGSVPGSVLDSAPAAPHRDRVLDLDRYFARTGYDGARDATLATLHGIARAHVQTIPFENLDVLLGRPIDLDLDA